MVGVYTKYTLFRREGRKSVAPPKDCRMNNFQAPKWLDLLSIILLKTLPGFGSPFFGFPAPLRAGLGDLNRQSIQPLGVWPRGANAALAVKPQPLPDGGEGSELYPPFREAVSADIQPNQGSKKYKHPYGQAQRYGRDVESELNHPPPALGCSCVLPSLWGEAFGCLSSPSRPCASPSPSWSL